MDIFLKLALAMSSEIEHILQHFTVFSVRLSEIHHSSRFTKLIEIPASLFAVGYFFRKAFRVFMVWMFTIVFFHNPNYMIYLIRYKHHRNLLLRLISDDYMGIAAL